MTGPQRPADHPPLKLRPKRRLLFPDRIELRLPRHRNSAAPVTQAQPARLATVTPTEPAVPPAAPSAPAATNRDVAVLDEAALGRGATRSRPAPRAAAAVDANERKPMYWRLLRLRHIRPNGWLRALFVEGSVGVAVVLVLAEKASVWTIIALPVLVAMLVKANDLVAGAVRSNR